MGDEIRIGVVGCGRILPAVLRGFRLLRESGDTAFRITALCARKPEDAMMFRQRGEGPPPREPVSTMAADPLSAPHAYVSDTQPGSPPDVYTDYRAMLAGAAVDAVLILTTVAAHHEIALACVDAGKHVLVEKPLAISVRAGRRMVEAAQRAGLVLATAEVARYRPETRAARWAIETGRIGRLQAVVGGGIGAGDWSPDRIVANTPWRHVKLLAGGGAAIDIGPHRFHVVRYVGGDVAEVSAVAAVVEPIRVTRDAEGAVVRQVVNEVDDLFFALLRFASGAVGQLSFSWAGHGQQASLPLSYYGSQGSLTGRHLARDGETIADVLQVFDRDADPALRARQFPEGLQDGFALEIRDWLDAIRRHGESETGGEAGLIDLAISYAVLEASLAHRWVRIEEVLSGDLSAYQDPIDRHYGLL
jgi:predicted dehydrogenase